MKFLIMTKIGKNRNKPRVWLETAYLQQCNFEAGDKILVTGSPNKLVIEKNDTATKIVSRRKVKDTIKPLIEVTGQVLETFDKGIEKLRVVMTSGKIIITPHQLYATVSKSLKDLYSAVLQKKKLDVISLFSGGGVLDRAVHEGLKLAGLDSVVRCSIEIETKYMQSNLRNNSHLFDSNSILIESPIQDLDFSRMGVSGDILIAGIPCTGASIGGKSKNKINHAEEHDKAGSLFYYLLQVIQKTNVPLIILECVKQYLDTTSMMVIRSVLSNLGYTLQETVLKGDDFGALEGRERMVVIASLDSIDSTLSFDDLRHYPVSGAVSTILDDVPLDSSMYREFKYLADKEAKDIASGKGFRRCLLNGDETKVPCIGAGYAKCRSNEPFVKHPSNEKLSRLFTVNEHARVKTIPEDIVHGTPTTVAHEVLGQSVIFKQFLSVAQMCGLGLKSFFGTLSPNNENNVNTGQIELLSA
ncbi:DNA cytosine methyltransferase [Aliivibrio fischeri]|uniref:DNA cytosine methyltransferase n=1 Tax=Aliivibrio fischeri TaxID=668 RepID=UPI0007C4F636|nr:DNA cytosine methyltransferase [Aliivibrio fischeri]